MSIDSISQISKNICCDQRFYIASLCIVWKCLRSGKLAAIMMKPFPERIFKLTFDVSFYDGTASTWTLATPRTTWEYFSGIKSEDQM